MKVSSLYEGHVWHVRHTPRQHRFRYRLSLLYLDLEELPRLFDGRLLWSVERPGIRSFRRRDYLGDEARPLDECVRDRVQDELGFRPAGPIRLLTQIRSLGFVFNPVSFYYCFALDGCELEAVVAEITNTPWGERHAYVLDARGGEQRWSFDKAFHVSPFFDMDHRYDWSFSMPGPRISVHMRNRQAGEVVFEAGVELERHALEPRRLARTLLTGPLPSLRVLAAIYGQALRLWWKRIPFFTHPSKRPSAIR